MNLTDHFLIAVPGMLDDSFDRSVVYVCEHNEQGALGLIVNKPIAELSLQQLFDKVELRLPNPILENAPVYYGGPVHTERGFVLHSVKKSVMELEENSMPSQYAASLQITSELKMTSSQEILDSIAAGVGPDQFLISLGYAGWSEGQLEQEMINNCWLTVKADSSIIFSTPTPERYSAALRLLGVDLAHLVSSAGHA